MSAKKQAEKENDLFTEIMELIDSKQSGLTVAGAIGCLECVKHELLLSMTREE